MANRGIHDGDHVLVQSDLGVSNGDVVLARAWSRDGDELGMVVNVFRDGRLWSDGEDEREPLIYGNHEILGRVVWVVSPGHAPIQAHASPYRRPDYQDRLFPTSAAFVDAFRALPTREQIRIAMALGLAENL